MSMYFPKSLEEAVVSMWRILECPNIHSRIDFVSPSELVILNSSASGESPNSGIADTIFMSVFCFFMSDS
jgi:hypothetical protein